MKIKNKFYILIIFTLFHINECANKVVSNVARLKSIIGHTISSKPKTKNGKIHSKNLRTSCKRTFDANLTDESLQILHKSSSVDTELIYNAFDHFIKTYYTPDSIEVIQNMFELSECIHKNCGNIKHDKKDSELEKINKCYQICYNQVHNIITSMFTEE